MTSASRVLYGVSLSLIKSRGNRLVCGTRFARSTAQTSARKACLFLYPFQRLRKRKLNQLWYFAYGSYQFKKLGSFGTSPNGSFHGTNFDTQSVLVFISASTFAQAQVEPTMVFRYRSYQFKKLGSFGTSPNGSFHGTNFGTQSVLVLTICGTRLRLVTIQETRQRYSAVFYICVRTFLRSKVRTHI